MAKAGARALARPDQSRSGEHKDGQHVDRREIDDACRLHHQGHRHGRITDGIPRKAGKNKTAEPFGDAEAERKGSDPAPAVGPKTAGNDDRQRVKNPENGWKADDGKGYRPGERVRFDQERIAQPPETAQKIAEAEGPADCGGLPQPPECAVGGIGRHPVDQPDEDWKRDESRRENAKWRLGKHRQEAGEKTDECPRHPGEKYDSACQSFH
ncbi:hypothetical protein ACVI55_001755 [Sinorhizobium medicae]